jgi:glycosyltransferase involved in cell wall biosynthesis
MKIAIVSPYISTFENLSCYQSQQINLAIELAKLGLHVDIITAKRHPSEPSITILDEQVKVHRLERIARWTERFFRQPIMIGLWKKLVTEKYYIVQSSEDYSFCTLVAGIYAAFKGANLIIYQGIYAYSTTRMPRLFARLYDFFIGAFLKRFYYIVVCKTSLASEYMKNKGYNRTEIIAVGVNTSLFYPSSGIEPKGINLLSVGNLIELKNYSMILDIFLGLINKGCDVYLTIIGTGPDKKKIKSFVETENLTNRFQLLEKIPNEKMRNFYSKADLFLLFSKIEIFGMVMLEAMACGCPVMATPTAGVLDVINDDINGFIISENNPTKIVERIAQIFDNPVKLEKIGQEAARTAKEQYSWEIIAKRYYNLYCRKMRHA